MLTLFLRRAAMVRFQLCGNQTTTDAKLQGCVRGNIRNPIHQCIPIISPPWQAAAASSRCCRLHVQHPAASQERYTHCALHSGCKRLQHRQCQSRACRKSHVTTVAVGSVGNCYCSSGHCLTGNLCCCQRQLHRGAQGIIKVKIASVRTTRRHREQQIVT